jgi:hypothetical protein
MQDKGFDEIFIERQPLGMPGEEPEDDQDDPQEPHQQPD